MPEHLDWSTLILNQTLLWSLLLWSKIQANENNACFVASNASDTDWYQFSCAYLQYHAGIYCFLTGLKKRNVCLCYDFSLLRYYETGMLFIYHNDSTILHFLCRYICSRDIMDHLDELWFVHFICEEHLPISRSLCTCTLDYQLLMNPIWHRYVLHTVKQSISIFHNDGWSSVGKCIYFRWSINTR